MPNPRDIQHLAQQYGPQIVGVIVALLTAIGLAVGLTQNPPGSSSSPDKGSAASASTTQQTHTPAPARRSAWSVKGHITARPQCLSTSSRHIHNSPSPE
mgnify:CR=1 FL=1